MGETEIIIFIILTSLVVSLFLGTGLLFIYRYRRTRRMAQTEKMQTEEQHKKELLETRLESNRQTMKHIGREIHDSVGQKLTLASLYVKQLELPGAGKDQRLMAIGAIIDESLSELRQLSHSLTHPDQAGAGLVALLRQETARINSTGICHVALTDQSGGLQPGEENKNLLFRLIQEFFQNSLKHAGCRKISVDLLRENDQLIIRMADDGCGFDMEALLPGIGLQNMKRRANQMNALYNLESSPGNGTRLMLKISCDEI